jgi:hypothetical protein
LIILSTIFCFAFFTFAFAQTSSTSGQPSSLDLSQGSLDRGSVNERAKSAASDATNFFTESYEWSRKFLSERYFLAVNEYDKEKIEISQDWEKIWNENPVIRAIRAFLEPAKKSN